MALPRVRGEVVTGPYYTVGHVVYGPNGYKREFFRRERDDIAHKTVWYDDHAKAQRNCDSRNEIWLQGFEEGRAATHRGWDRCDRCDGTGIEP